MKIAIIDSGIDRQHDRLEDASLSGVTIKITKNKTECISSFEDEIGHGTACASIIHSHNKDAELVGVKVLDEDYFTDENTLVCAIEWCIQNKIDIINISLGVKTDNPLNDLVDICKKAYDENIIVISSESNNDSSIGCYPAYLPTVFGVTAGQTKNKNEYGLDDRSEIDFIAKGDMQRVAWKDNEYRIGGGNSFACAHFTGIVSKIKGELKIHEIPVIKKKLIERSTVGFRKFHEEVKDNRDIANYPFIKRHDLDELGNTIFNNTKRLEWVNKIAVFPVSEKELNTSIEYPEYAKYNVVQYYDYPRSLSQDNNKRHLSSITNKMPLKSEINKIDTFVLGLYHYSKFNSNVRYGYHLLAKLLECNRNIIVYNKTLHKNVEEAKQHLKSSSRIYIPIVDKKQYNNVMYFRHLKELRVPVLSVIGTSPRQGKYTTQLILNSMLQEEGYKTSLVSTEPQGDLFGADLMFPYKNVVDLDKNDWALYLRVALKGIQEYIKPHIIITGIQGWLIPRKYDDPLGEEFTAMQYLYGIYPDISICVINPDDSIEYIRKTTNALKIYCGTENIAYVMSPFVRKVNISKKRVISDYEKLEGIDYLNKLDEMNNKLNKPVYNITEKNTDIVKLIENSLT